MSACRVLAFFLACCSVQYAVAATFSTSATAPVVDGEDIANLVGANDAGGNLGHVWNNRPVHGQTFTTGADPRGYTLSSVSLKSLSSTTTGNWTVRVGTVSGTTFTPIATETATGGPISANDFATFVFATALDLDPNTLYAFDIDTDGNGFISANNTGDVLAGSTAFSSGTNGVPSNPLTLHSFDRVFHVDLVVGAPEPASIAIWSLFGLGLAGFGYYRVRRKK